MTYRQILVKSILDRYGIVNYLGILETSCFPSSFYAYFVRPDGRGEYVTTDHATCYYHRTIEEAQGAFAHYQAMFQAQRESGNGECAHGNA